MSNTYTQIHLQLVFAVKYRAALIKSSWEEELHKYISGIVRNQNHKLLCINGVEDHLHLLIGFRTHQSLGDLLKEIKVDSSLWINKNNFVKSKFEWQGGYDAFSYSKEALPNLINYIQRQKEHHRKITLEEEYIGLLNEFGVEYDERYILKTPV